MTVYNTAYDTTICSGFQMQRIVDAIKEAHAREYLNSADKVFLVDSNQGARSTIPAFDHPLFVGHNESHQPRDVNASCLAVDLRPACRYDDVKSNVKVINSSLYKSRIYRAALNSVWITEGPASLRTLTPMAMSVFASWISEAIARRFGLDPKTQYDLMILAGIFYSSNHVDGTEYENVQENRHLAGIASNLKANLDDVIKVYDSVKLVVSLQDFCVKAKSYLNNIRLEDLNTGLLISLMKGTWYGDNAAENTAVALEHPPTWMALLLEAYTNTAMKHSTIYKICERRQHKDGLEMLVRAVKAMASETATVVAKIK